ncbi:MAG: universal stress protein [Candidatus Tectomicrobia bacterium]|uniref:Universal stress protein n=1 Tax=Tectimicrobiota bacterium TaxID=2528274 RepID=A0A937VX89_UNCTE|nr:universal stress protein [Candidatus Tectomicrobia bacterium]
MYTRILIATGGSPWSDAAAAYAIAMAAHLHAELRILSVLNVSGVYTMPDVMASSDMLMDSIEQQGQDMLAHTTSRAFDAGVPHTAILKWGNVAESILQTAAEEQCDLIVLGSRGLSGFKRLMLGSISNAVAAKAQCPVLIIKQPPMGPFYWRRVLVATGGSPWSDAAVGHAIALAKTQHLDVSMVYVEQRRSRRTESLLGLTSDGKSVLALAEARATEAGVSCEARLVQGEVAPTILHVAEEQGCDAIVLGSRGLTGFKRLMLGSTSNAVAATAPMPVLIVKRFLLS